MRNRLSYVVFAALAVACNPQPVPMGDSGVCPTGRICVMDGGTDTGPGRDAWMGDTGDQCNGSGHVGSHCRTGGAAQCQSPSTCNTPQAGWTTFQATFQIPSGILVDPAHPDYQMIDTSATAAVTPFNAFSGGGLCFQQCDTTAAAGATGACGMCTLCSTTVTQIPLMAIFGGIQNFVATPTYGTNTGACRLECTYDITTAGVECPPDFTCEQFGNVCVEACTNNNECNTAYGVTYEGELVTIVNDMNPSTCNTATGRCDGPTLAHAGAMVGDHCDSNADCAPGNGICLSGGHCGEIGCPGPNTMTSVCGGTPSSPRGVCLSTSAAAHPTTICIMGCMTSADCGAGDVCNILYADAAQTMPFPIGPFAGYCVGQCARDEECNNSATIAEACTDYNTVDAMTGAVTSNPGRCTNRCTTLHAVGTATTATPGQCLTTEYCAPDVSNSNGHACTATADCASQGTYNMCIFGTCHSAMPTFGECQPLGAFCGAANTRSLPALQADCAATQVCDETAATPHNAMTHAVRREQFGDGHCVNPCTTTADCAAPAHPTGSVCVTTGALAGLCRVPCTSTTTADAGMECPVDQVCDPALMYCVEVAPPAM